MKKISVIVLFLGIVLSAFAVNKYSKQDIDKITNAIDNNSSLRTQILDTYDVYDIAFDGGGEINIFWNKDEIKKIHQEIGTSYGRLSTTFYFNDEKIIKIIETEENFKFNQDMSIDYSSGVSEVFKEEIYVLDYDNEITKTYKTGKRKVSVNIPKVSEYYKKADFIIKWLK